MPDINQQIYITATFMSKLGGMNKAISTIEKLRAAGEISDKQQQKAFGLLKKSDKQTFNITQKLRKYDEKQRKLNEAKKKDIAQTIKLRGAYLGLMFTGMALVRIFGGMVKSVLDILGVGDMLNATILTVLLPALEPLADILYSIMEWFMDLPEPVQKAIGIFVLAATAVGYLMMTFGFLMTAGRAIAAIFGGGGIIGKAFTGLWSLVKIVFTGIWGSVKWLWGGLIMFVEWVAAALGVSFGVAAAIILAVIAVITLLIFGAIAAWKNNFLGFKDAVIGVWNAIKTVILGFVQFWTGIWNIIVGIFTLNGEKIKQGWNLIGEGIKNMFRGVVNFVANILNALIGLVISALAQIVRAAQWIWNKIPGHAKVTWYEDIMSSGAGKKLIPTFQTGGVMPHTGLAMLHAGETITPAGEQNINNAPNITINATISSDYDVKRLADQLNKYWSSSFDRISKGRGTI